MKRPTVAVLDYGIGNVKSICNALENIGAKPVLTANHSVIKNADSLILPGVGAFSQGMKNLDSSNLTDSIFDFVRTGRPFLGICLGMQMLMEESEEFGLTKGLGLIKGKVIRMPFMGKTTAKLPHVSWNELRKPNVERWKGTILEETPEYSDVYFVHTFVAVPDDVRNILAISNYGGRDFCAAVQHKNVTGTQFHPEKSGSVGLSILSKFIKNKESEL